MVNCRMELRFFGVICLLNWCSLVLKLSSMVVVMVSMIVMVV